MNPSDAPAAGRLTLICGSMFAGKTGRLIRELQAAAVRGRAVAAFKHALDARYAPAALATHDGMEYPATAVSEASMLEARAGDALVIGVDEVHFFGRGFVPVVERLLAAGKHVIAVGLENDAWGRSFPPFPQLKELAMEIVLLHAPCRVCGRPSPYSQRMAPVTDEFMVGGVGDYEPRCRRCFTPLPPPAPEY